MTTETPDTPRSEALTPPTICMCGSAKSYHPRPDHDYEPRYEPNAWREGYRAALLDRDWHAVEVRPDDIAALLERVTSGPALTEAEWATVPIARLRPDTPSTEALTPEAVLDAIDAIVDDTHPEGDGCPLCVALDDLRERLDAERAVRQEAADTSGHAFEPMRDADDPTCSRCLRIHPEAADTSGLREALARLDLRCENYVGRDHRPDFDQCKRNGRTRGGEYGSDQWCLPCEVRAALEGATERPLDVERLGFTDLLDIADALLTHYPPHTIVCTHNPDADIGARTAAAIADLVASCRARLTSPTTTEEA